MCGAWTRLWSCWVDPLSGSEYPGLGFQFFLVFSVIAFRALFFHRMFPGLFLSSCFSGFVDHGFILSGVLWAD